MIHLNAGNLWENDYLDTVIAWNKEFADKIQVTSLFGSISGLTPTARSADRIPYRDWDFVEEYVDKCDTYGIAIRYTLNHSCIGSIQSFKDYWENTLKEIVIRLHNAGIREWTVTSPLILHLLRDLFPTDFLEVSTIAELATPEEARRWESLGANGANLSTSINRDFEAIHAIGEHSDILMSILANEACLFRCTFRRECYNLSSHDSWRGSQFFDSYPFKWCNELRMNNSVEWVKARMVLPQWMTQYEKITGVHNFKIAFRTHPKEVALPILRAYMEQDFHGNLLSLWPTIAHLGNTAEPQKIQYIDVDKLESHGFFEHFVKNGHNCNTWSCESCSYCDSLAEEITHG